MASQLQLGALLDDTLALALQAGRLAQIGVGVDLDEQVPVPGFVALVFRHVRHVLAALGPGDLGPFVRFQKVAGLEPAFFASCRSAPKGINPVAVLVVELQGQIRSMLDEAITNKQVFTHVANA